MSSVFQFDKKSSKLLKKLQHSFNLKSKSDVLICGITLLQLVAAAQNEDQHIVIESPDGHRREIII